MANNYSKKRQINQSGNFKNTDSSYSYDPIKKVEILNIEEWHKQIDFYRKHLDIFIEEVFEVRLFDFQKVIAREVGNSNNTILIEPRSIGKTWLIAVILLALGVLYSGAPIGIMSGNVKQANIVIKRYIDKKLVPTYPNIAREIIFPIKIAKDQCIVNLKSGSFIETTALGSSGDGARGSRYKFVVVDESRLVKNKMFPEIIKPMLQEQRQVYYDMLNKGFKPEEINDIDSKLIQISSAYLKTCSLFDRFKFALDRISEGNINYFACALHFKTGIRTGIIKKAFVEEAKLESPKSVFQYEWEGIFVGSAEGSHFPFDLSEPCRVLKQIEIRQPKSSQSKYIIILDPATSEEKWGDNASLQVYKLKERNNGTYFKDLVKIKTYHGFQLDQLAEEIRKAYIEFPNTVKIVIDVNAIGEGLIPLLDSVWVDPDTNKEYPPLVPDDDERRMNIPGALVIIRAVVPNNKSNNSMATYLKLSLENKTLRLPIPSVELTRDEEDKVQLSIEETAVFLETDALIFEMSNIRQRTTSSNNVVYEKIESNMRKDRYTCCAMGLDFIRELEDENKDKLRDSGDICWGVTSTF
jgi:hypothetical protein